MNNLNDKLIASKIAIASDHRGFQLKSTIVDYLRNMHCEVIDYGTNSDNPVDYPDYAKKLLDSIQSDIVSFGILICGSGIGMSICANRKPFARAALCHSNEYAKLAREHNDANILVLGAGFLDVEEALQIALTFFTTQFIQVRHKIRIEKINI